MTKHKKTPTMVIYANQSAQATVDYQSLKNLRMRIRAVDHHLRKKILNLLNEGRSLDVTTIYKKMKLEQSECSLHLAILRRNGFLDTKRVGKHIYYSVNVNGLKKLSQAAKIA